MDRTDETDDRGVLDQFRWSLQALAMEAEVQVTLFPDFVCKTDELGLDYGHWSEVARSFFGADFTRDQNEAIRSLDLRFDAMSRGGAEFDEELWSEESLSIRPQWEELRSLARLVLSRFGWPVEMPPRGRAIYARGRPTPADFGAEEDTFRN